MGMEGVELILAVEEAFQISISDEEAGAIVTPRHLVDLIFSRHATAVPACLSQRAFYLVRRAARQSLEAPRSALKPRTRWDELIPLHDMRRAWPAFWRATGARRPPRLRLSSMGRRLSVASACAALIPSVLMGIRLGHPFALPLGATSAALVLVLALATPWRRYVPAECVTLGETSRYLATFLPALAAQRELSYSPSEVETTVRALIQQVSGNEDRFDLDTPFKDILSM